MVSRGRGPEPDRSRRARRACCSVRAVLLLVLAWAAGPVSPVLAASNLAILPLSEVRPGMTGLSQISGRNTLTVEGMLPFDERYVDEYSLALDMKIALKTVPVVLSSKGYVPPHQQRHIISAATQAARQPAKQPA